MLPPVNLSNNLNFNGNFRIGQSERRGADIFYFDVEDSPKFVQDMIIDKLNGLRETLNEDPNDILGYINFIHLNPDRKTPEMLCVAVYDERGVYGNEYPELCGMAMEKIKNRRERRNPQKIEDKIERMFKKVQEQTFNYIEKNSRQREFDDRNKPALDALL